MKFFYICWIEDISVRPAEMIEENKRKRVESISTEPNNLDEGEEKKILNDFV